jgi:hypothetical protein
VWVVRYLPLQDLPFHESTLRIIHSYRDPAYGFTDNFLLRLEHTPYPLYYLVASVLSSVIEVRAASAVMACLYLGGTPLALRALLRALGKDERLSLFVVPLLVNQMFMFGLMPYLVGIPLMFVALAVAVSYVNQPTWSRGVVLATLAVGLFYTHVVPYALFGLGVAALCLSSTSSLRGLITNVVPIVPSVVAVGVWISRVPVGRASWHGLGAATTQVARLDEALALWPRWSIDVFRDQTDERYFIGLVILMLVALGLAQGDPDRTHPRARTLTVVPIACVLAYFLTADSLAGVWLFSQRFPVPALVLLLPMWRMPQGRRGVGVTAAAVGLATLSTLNTCQHFVAFERDEVGQFERALDAMEPRRRVAALIYDKGSAVVNLWPFLHFGQYYQVDRGGVVQFSNAAWFSWWPVQFKPSRYPPPGTRPRPRWEWTPEQVPIGELYPYYDYVLTRGEGFHPPPGTFHHVYRDLHWTVFKRDDE